MTSIEVRRLGNKILAMGVATVLALSAIGVATPALTPAPVYATNYENNDKHYDDKDKHYDNNDNTMTTMTNTMTTMTIIIHNS